MDFTWNDTQQTLWDDLLAFGRDELEHNLIERDAHAEFSEANWQAIAEKGILGLCMPQTYGGSGYDIVTTVHALEALGYGYPDNGMTLAVNGQIWSIQEPILKFGTDIQKQKYLPKMIDGTFKAADGITEPDSGSDAFALQTTATKVDGGYLLNGNKTYIGFAPIADVILAFATVNPDVGHWGVTTFIVDAGSDGITLSEAKSKMGLRTSPLGDITFKDVFVPDENILGRAGSGASIFNATMVYERGFIFASHIGAMARQLDTAIKFVKERQVGGQSIGKYQAISHRIANMKIRLETARMFIYKTASLVDHNKNANLESAMAKLAISECFVENSFDAIRVHGGRGYLSEYGIERDLRDAMGGVIYGGTSDIQRNVIAALLGL